MPFQFQAPSDNYGKTIAQLIQERGQQLAQGQAASGNAWANAVGQVGQIAAAVPQQIQQAKVQQQEGQIRQGEIDKAANAQKYQKATNSIIAGLTVENPDGSHTVDRTKLQNQMAQQNIPLPMQKDVLSSLDEVDKSVQMFTASKIDHMADLANSVIKSGSTPEAFTMAAALAKANGLATDDQLHPIFDAISNGKDVKSLMSSIRSMSEKYKDADKGIVLPPTPRGGSPATLVSPEGGAPIATGAAAQPAAPTIVPAGATAIGQNGEVQFTSPEHKSFEQKSVTLDGKPNTLVNFDPKLGKYFLPGTDTDVSARITGTPPASMQINQNLVPTGDALDMAAKNYLATGQLPNLGRDPGGARIAIMNAAAKIDPHAALSANAATYKADSANLKNLQTTEGTLSAFEKTSGKNLDQFLSLADKVPDTGIPWLNVPIRQVNKSLVGSANQAAFDAARNVALREIARVTNDPKLSGALTDSARQEVSSLSQESATFAQIFRVAKVLKQDMANVHSGLNEQIATVKAGLKDNPAVPSATAPIGKFNPSTMKIEYTDGR